MQAGLGTLISKFSNFSFTLAATAEYGHFIASSKWQAIGVEVVGKANLVFDHVTPEFGLIGGALRRVGRRSGLGFGSVDYERLSVGPTFMSRGSNLDVGLGAELAFGVLTFHGAGLGVFVDGYFFRPTDMLGPDTILVAGLGYVQSAITGLRPSVAIDRPAPREHSVSDHPCPRLEAYQSALTEARKHAVTVCNERDAEACEAARSRVLYLNAGLTACEEGDTVPPPDEVNDAPAH